MRYLAVQHHADGLFERDFDGPHALRALPVRLSERQPAREEDARRREDLRRDRVHESEVSQLPRLYSEFFAQLTSRGPLRFLAVVNHPLHDLDALLPDGVAEHADEVHEPLTV